MTFASKTESAEVLLFRSELDCKISDPFTNIADPLVFIPLISVLAWVVFYPLSQFFALRAAKDDLRNARDKKVMYKWALMVNGYKADYWWWEVLVYFRKSAGYILFAIPFSGWKEDARILCFLLMAIFFSCLQVYFDPFDSRSNGLLTKIELHH